MLEIGVPLIDGMCYSRFRECGRDGRGAFSSFDQKINLKLLLCTCARV